MRALRHGDDVSTSDPALPPTPPSVELLLGGREARAVEGDRAPRAVPASRTTTTSTVETGLAVPAVRGAPCDVRRLFDEPAAPPPEPAPDACPGGT